MQNYSYTVMFEHGSASGEVQAVSPKEAQTKVKAMYHNNQYDAVNAKGEPVIKKVVVTKVTVKLVKE